jgi:glycosyltransferase involved in cell wall biosynthesis
MRLLHVVPTYLPSRRYGGPIVAVHGLCKALAARGHQVEVYTTNVDGPDTLAVPTDVPVDMDSVTIRYFSSRFRRLYWSSAMKEVLDREVANHDLVHIHAVYLWPGAAAARAARRHSVPYVISPRGMLVRELIRRKSRLIKTAWLAFVERSSFAHASAIHFTSSLERDEATRIGLPLPRPFVVPNGVEVPPPGVGPRDERTLVFLGRVNWKKRLEAVIELLPRLPGVRFLVAGNDEEQLTPRLRARAQELAVADRVEFLGPLYGQAKDDFLARGTLFVLPSRSENFGNAVLEALAMETPVVLSPEVGLADDVVGAGAGVVGLEAIESLLSSPERRAEMGRRGRALVESRFTWPRVAEQMEEAYRCSIASRP